MKRLIAILVFGLCFTGALQAGDSENYKRLYIQAGLIYGIDPAIVEAVAEIESSHRPYAVSSSGARGLMQLMPKTAAWYCGIQGYELYDVRKNVFCGTSYLAYVRRLNQGSLSLALAAYYTGPGTVKRNGYRVPRKAIPYIKKFQLALNRIRSAPNHQREQLEAMLAECGRFAALARAVGAEIPGL